MGTLITQREWARQEWLAHMRERRDPEAPMTGDQTLAILERTKEVRWLHRGSSIVISVTAGSSET
jgi:hypothetical protein